MTGLEKKVPCKLKHILREAVYDALRNKVMDVMNMLMPKRHESAPDGLGNV